MFIFLIIVVIGIVCWLVATEDDRNARWKAKYEKEKHKEWLSYQSPQRREQERMWERYQKRRAKAESSRYAIYEAAMKRGYRFRKYTENKSYSNWEEEQTEINGRKWDWKLTEHWEIECKRHHEKWGTTPND